MSHDREYLKELVKNVLEKVIDKDDEAIKNTLDNLIEQNSQLGKTQASTTNHQESNFGATGTDSAFPETLKDCVSEIDKLLEENPEKKPSHFIVLSELDGKGHMLDLLKEDSKERILETLSNDQMTNTVILFNTLKIGANDIRSTWKDVLKHFGKIDYHIESETIKEDLKTILKKNCDKDVEDLLGVPKYDETFVSPQADSQLDGIHFPEDNEKGFAVVTCGESGAGKTWFAKRTLPRYPRFQNSSFIYTEVGNLKDDKCSKAEKQSLEGEAGKSRKFYGKVLKVSAANMFGSTLLHDLLSEISESLSKDRDTYAIEIFHDLIKSAFHGSEASTRLTQWWEGTTSNVGELVIIIDEVGRSQSLTRGLISQVRKIYMDIRNKNLANKILLVLVGCGLDKFIGDDSPDDYTRIGSDPTKSRVAQIVGPNLGKAEIYGVHTEDITFGTISRVLATNTRMLARGVIPVLTSAMNLKGFTGDARRARQREIGSNNFAMDYAARVYVTLNGLGMIKCEQRREILFLKQFGLIMKSHLNGNSTNPMSKSIGEFLQEKISEEDKHTLWSLGLITSDIKSTSKALRYLSCNGQTAPLYAKDGVGFEVVLQHHLVRYLEMRYRLEHPNVPYFSERFNLVQAWPPATNKKEGELSSETVVKQNVNDMYYYFQEMYQLPHNSDLHRIENALKNRNGDFDLVMRQTAPNAQGPDVIVLCGRGNNLFLDLYQAKHLDKIPSQGSKEVRTAFSSLGVIYDATLPAAYQFHTTPKVGSAGYSFLGMEKLTEGLFSKLLKIVEVRNRCLVFSGDFDRSTTWPSFEFEQAEAKNVFVWTKELMHPTISALDPEQLKAPHKIPNLEFSGMEEIQENDPEVSNPEFSGMQENSRKRPRGDEA